MDVTSKYGEVLMPFVLQMQLVDHFPHYKLLNIDNIHIDCQADSVVVYSFLFTDGTDCSPEESMYF